MLLEDFSFTFAKTNHAAALAYYLLLSVFSLSPSFSLSHVELNGGQKFSLQAKFKQLSSSKGNLLLLLKKQ